MARILIRSNHCDGSRFHWDWHGFLLVTPRWVFATGFQARVYR